MLIAYVVGMYYVVMYYKDSWGLKNVCCKHLIYYPGTMVALSASIGIWIKQYILYSFGERGTFCSMGGLICNVKLQTVACLG